jgi:hypothetical protein
MPDACTKLHDEEPAGELCACATDEIATVANIAPTTNHTRITTSFYLPAAAAADLYNLLVAVNKDFSGLRCLAKYSCVFGRRSYKIEMIL